MTPPKAERKNKMKKLMIALGVACAAVALNAASTDWSITAQSFKMSDGVTLPKATPVYFLDTKAANFAALKTALTDGSADYANLAAVMASTLFTSVAIDNATTFTSTLSFQMNSNYAKVDTRPASVAAAGISSQYAIFVADGENYLISQAVEGKSYEKDPNEGVEAAFGASNFTDANSISKGWQAYSSVPEPTSGLLLLLGVAGLALRRRRA